MTYGYAGKIADVDLTSGRVTEFIPDETALRQYIGGRGLATKILWDRLGARWTMVDPLGVENLLVALTGPLTGFLGGTRICVSGKSPLSNGIVGSTASGEFAIELRCAGYDGVIVKGAAKSPVYILITDGKVEVRDATKFWGMGGIHTVPAINKEVRELLKNRHPNTGLWKEPSMLYTGPAGESLVRNAAVMQKWSHACGYGGYGAVMGSKKLKALVAKGTGPLPEVANHEELVNLMTNSQNSTFSDPQRNFWGTGAGGYSTGAEESSEPVRNWQEEYHNEKSIGVINLETRNWVKRYWGDYGCMRTCLKLATVRSGPFKGAITDNPDYELEAYCGANLGIFDPDGVVYMAAVIDDLGMSGINSANTIGFAAELFQRGILTKKDFNGIEPKWGDAKAMAALANLITERKAIGDVLAEGTFRAAKKISEMKNVDCMEYAVQFKGIEVGAHGIRTGHHFANLAYALSTQGGDHTSTLRPPIYETNATISDSMVYCNISIGFGVTGVAWPYLKAVTGWDVTQEEWMTINGRRIIQIQRAALLLGGPDVFWAPDKDDDNPPRWYTPLPSGPFKGSAPKKEDVRAERQKVYIDMGWDDKGIPTTEELTKLGLDDVDKALEHLRK
ncbi:MAG: aldehyde ferredoxin oxidoreductase C-terminal domain-containing protein [Candidatus Bathyarchaeota archaeon]